MRGIVEAALAAATLALGGPAMAQIVPEPQAVPEAQVVSAPASGREEGSLRVYFGSGSAQVAADQEAALDQAARLFRDGGPIVMVVAGGADTVGLPARNLDLSIRRAQAVADGLVARGIPAERLQILGRGTSELAVETEVGVDSRENRRVEISWR